MPAKNTDDVFVYLLNNQFSEVEKCSRAANRLKCLIPNLLTSYTHDVKWLKGCISGPVGAHEQLVHMLLYLQMCTLHEWRIIVMGGGGVIVLYLAPLLFCILCVAVVYCAQPWARRWYFLCLSVWGGRGGGREDDTTVQCESSVRMYYLYDVYRCKNVKNTLTLSYLICIHSMACVKCLNKWLS